MGKKIVINECSQCPKLTVRPDRVISCAPYCDAEHRAIPYMTNHNAALVTTVIPEWCPLEDE